MEGLISPLDPTFLAEAIDIVGSSNVLRDNDVVAGFCTDWTGRFVGRAPAVVRPGSTAEVEALVVSCRRHGVALALQGGNTSLSGGTVPLRDEVVCSLRRLTDLEVDGDAGQATSGAGVVLADLHEAAAPPAGATGSTWPAGRAPPSEGMWRPMPVGYGCCATATPGPSSSG